MLNRIFALAGAVLFFASPSFAATGIVVRLSTGGEAVDSPVEAILTNSDGVVTSLTLLDNGEAPDVNAGDHNYSASSMLEGENFTVTLSLGGTAEEVGEVSWAAEVTARDLVITRYDGIVTLETGAGDNGQPMGEPASPGAAGGEPAQGSATGDPVDNPAVNGTAPARGPNVTFSSTGSGTTPENDSTLYIIGGVLLLILAAVAFFWFREPTAVGSKSSTSDSALVHRLPEPGLLGDGTPSLSEGSSVWTVEADATTEFMALLLGSMAAHHRVVVVAPGSNPIPLVHGGPVYRMKNPRPGHVGEAVAELMQGSGQPVSVLVDATRMEESMLSDYADLVPGELGIVFIRNTPHKGPERSLTATKTDDGWSIIDGESRVVLRMNEWGIATEKVG